MQNLSTVSRLIIFLLVLAGQLFAEKKVAVVLSGGGAQAMAHIGVLRAFEEQQIPIDYLIGSSGGSIIGGLYAAGVSLDELEMMAQDGTIMKLFLGRQELTDVPVYQRQFRKSGNFSVREYEGNIVASPGLLNDKLIWKELFLLTAPANYQAHSNFDSLLIPFRAIGADVVNRQAVAIDSGSLAEALRISMSMPLIYPPVIKENRMFLDGGIYAKMPTFAAQDLKADVVIAVNAGDPTPQANKVRDVFDFFDTINALLFSYSDSNNVKGWDYYINVDTEGFNVFDFSGGEGLIERGYVAGKKTAQKLSRDLVRKRNMEVFSERQRLFRNALDGTLIDSINWISKRTGRIVSPRYHIELPFEYSTGKMNSLMNALYATNTCESLVPSLGDSAGQLNFTYTRKARWNVTPEIKISSVDGFYLMTNFDYHIKGYKSLSRLQAGIGNRKADYRYSFSPIRFWYADDNVSLNYFWELTHSANYHSYHGMNLQEENFKSYSSDLSFRNHFVLSWNQELVAGVGTRYSYWKNINSDTTGFNYDSKNPSFYPFVELSYQYHRLKRTIPFALGWMIKTGSMAGTVDSDLFYTISIDTRFGKQLSKKFHFGLDAALQTSSGQTPLELLADTQIPAAFTESHFFNQRAYSTLTIAPAITSSFFRNDLFLTVKSMNAYLKDRISGQADDWSHGLDTFITYNSILGQLQLGWSFLDDENYQAVSWTKVHIYL